MGPIVQCEEVASLGRYIGGKFVIQMLLRGDVKLLDLWMICASRGEEMSTTRAKTIFHPLDVFLMEKLFSL